MQKMPTHNFGHHHETPVPGSRQFAGLREAHTHGAATMAVHDHTCSREHSRQSRIIIAKV